MDVGVGITISDGPKLAIHRVDKLVDDLAQCLEVHEALTLRRHDTGRPISCDRGGDDAL